MDLTGGKLGGIALLVEVLPHGQGSDTALIGKITSLFVLGQQPASPGENQCLVPPCVRHVVDLNTDGVRMALDDIGDFKHLIPGSRNILLRQPGLPKEIHVDVHGHDTDRKGQTHLFSPILSQLQHAGFKIGVQLVHVTLRGGQLLDLHRL